ncbi:hypothetical protein O181_034098 [Austropuccinia psidii MF-1]|uniref:RNase H type-1 domain-containing protein n=1 Tax=Austropuccinia psidii MF-1 TaxID=1389203 RepID=A0A9Q3D4S6_9BASI|nr:hypothetical protein [Austropuccinia psidii MF-1]
MRQTPSPFLKLYRGIKDLTKQHIKLTHNYLHTKLTGPIDNAYKMLIWRELNVSQQTHSSPLNNVLEKDTFLRQHSTRAKTQFPFPIPPWSSQIAGIINLQLIEEQAKSKVLEQIETELAANTLVLFSDGSLILGKGGGAAAILTNMQKRKITYVGGDSIITNFETELMALFLFQQLLVKHIITHGPPQAIAVFSDSQTAL